ncbi:hypothetical protein VM1G_05515 [Cytospora mali]|uniref:Uncharacterized protein n=1 Tax=Cytospora mali TaxID=578113 RepID=A0A194VYX0_CYTMA|nr:hypothetical protein VM1G_05515 [Valsa mali]
MVVNHPESQSSHYKQQEGPSDQLTTHSKCDTNCSANSTIVDETFNQLAQAAWPHITSDGTNNSNHDNPPHDLSNDVKLRQKALDDILRRGRRKAETEYLRTCDAGVFDQYLAPFVAGKKSPKRKWVLDESTQRWYLYDPDTEEVLWCPTAESFA